MEGRRDRVEIPPSFGVLDAELLSDLTEAIWSSSQDSKERLARLADVVVPRLADWFMVELLDEHDQLDLVVLKHSDPVKAERARAIHARFHLEARGRESGARQALAKEGTVLTPEITPEMMQNSECDQNLVNALAEFNLSSRVHAPMVSLDNKLLGVLTFVYSESGRRYSQKDVPMLADIGRRCGLSVQHDRLSQAVENSLTDFRRLFQANPEPMWVFDAETLHFLEVNEAAIERYGYTREEFLKMQITDIRPREDVELLASALKEDRERNLVPAEDWRHQTKTGETIHVSIASHTIRYDGRRARLVVAHDVTSRVQAESNLARKMSQLSSLHTIDQAITGSMDINVTLGVVLEQVLLQLEVDAAQVLVMSLTLNTLNPVAARGFRGRAVHQRALRIGEGHAGRAALERSPVVAADLREETLVRRELTEEEGFIAYVAMPLIARGQVQGVLELFHRSPLAIDADWMAFLETLAGQTAIAVDSLSMLERLQRANTELTVAYDATIEGWSRALDLRDRETQGHSRRVTEMAVDVARQMGVPEGELVHIRRGALLHDIGKMAIPDSILLKAGPLSGEEMDVIRQHPVIASELLAPIPYLRAAMAIPSSHHERWDGSGYPLGLKGQSIPLAARIFAVVDVYDALVSDRPYRKAWRSQEARDYIKEQAGTHFDLDVVRNFLALI